MNTQNLLTLLAALSMALPASAQLLSANQGLDKLKANVENAKANQKEYDKNLDIVKNNIKEVTRAKETYSKQKETVSGEIVKNNDSLKKVLTQERDLTNLINQEKEKLATEAKQLEQLEKLLAQIQTNKAQRQATIAEYQNQLQMAAELKKAWKDRETELRAQESKTIQSIRSLASEEASWNNKKKGYENESKRWLSETEKQQKIHDTYQGLAKQGQ